MAWNADAARPLAEAFNGGLGAPTRSLPSPASTMPLR